MLCILIIWVDDSSADSPSFGGYLLAYIAMLFDSCCSCSWFSGVRLVTARSRQVTVLFLDVIALIFLFIKWLLCKRGHLRTWIEVALCMKLLQFSVNWRVSRAIWMLEIFILNISYNNWGASLYSTTLFLYRIRVFHEGIRRFKIRAGVHVLRMLNLLKHFNQVSLHHLFFIVNTLRILEFLVRWWSGRVILTADRLSSSNYGISFSIFLVDEVFEVLGMLTTHRFLVIQRRRDRRILMNILSGSHCCCLP